MTYNTLSFITWGGTRHANRPLAQPKNFFQRNILYQLFAPPLLIAKLVTSGNEAPKPFSAKGVDALLCSSLVNNLVTKKISAATICPAGRLLDSALKEAGIDRSQTYVTNVVKHFKWEPRGKRRIHKKPNAGEISACRPSPH